MLQADDVRLASEEEMKDVFHDCDVGAEPPVGRLYDTPTYLDRGMAADAYVVFQDGSHRQAVKLSMADYMRVAQPTLGAFARGAG